MKRFVYGFIGLLLLAVVAVLVLRWWITGTEAGTGFALSQVKQVLGTQLSIGNQRGTLEDGLVLSNVRYQAPGTSVDAQQIQISARLKLLPWPNLHVRRLQIDNVDVQLSQSVEQNQAEQASDIPSLASPVAVQLDDLRINQLSVQIGAEAEPIVITSLQTRFRYAQQLDLQQLVINADGINLEASGDSALQPPFQQQLKLTLNNNDAPWLPGLQGLDIEAQTQGSLRELNLDISTSGALAVELDATLQNLLADPTWQLSLITAGPELSWPAQTDSTAADVIITELMLTSEGGLDAHNTEINATLSHPQAIQGDWQLSISGDLEQLIIEQLSGPVLQGSISGTGAYTLSSTTPQARLALQMQDIKPDTGQPELDTLPGISGTLEARLDGQVINLEGLNLRVPNTDWRVSGDGNYVLDTQQLAADINWQQLNWPPQSGNNSQFVSRQGQLGLAGVLSELDININTDISGQQIPETAILLQGQLGEASLALYTLTLETLEGQLDITGDIDLQTGIGWDVSVVARQINPGLQWPDFPGSINMQATSNGRQTEAQLNAVMDIQQLDGNLRDQPISGNGRLEYIGGSIRTDGLELNSGTAVLNLEGDEQALQADIVIPELGDLLPQASGAVRARIDSESIDGKAIGPGNLKLVTDINVTDLSWQQWQAEMLTLSGEAVVSDRRLFSDMLLVIEQLQLPDQAPIDRLETKLNADNGQQQLQLTIQHAQADIDVRLGGNWDQWPSPNAWQGVVQAVAIENKRTGRWALSKPAPLSITADDLLLQHLCLSGPASGGAKLPGICIDYQQQAVNQIKVNILDLPLALAEALFDTGVRSENLISGQLQATWTDQLQQLNGELQLSAGDIRFLGRDGLPLKINGGNLRLALTESQRLWTQLKLTIEDTNIIEGDIRYGPVTAEQEQLSGTVKLDMPNMNWLRKPVPELDRIAGELQLMATLSGPVRQPLVALDLNLQDGEIRYQPLGLQLQNLQLDGHSEPGETLNLTGSFTAGEEGQAELTASLDPDSRVAKLDIKGESLQLFNSKAIKVRISPNIQLSASPDGYQIAGELVIPAARITPPEGATSRVTESEDVILVGTEQPLEQEPVLVPVRGQLKIVLGEHVRINADVAKTRLTGGLDLAWVNQPMPMANGIVRLIDGRVQAYGQALDLEGSRVVYNDAPLDNPRLDIRAVRRIFGDPQVEQAGVAVTGRAQEPDVQVFTTPATTEESALAYIATGSNFDHANGQGALNLGIYLFPKLFVSYGLGLFDNGNTANARYEFSEHWDVSVESGSRDTGVDLNWRNDG